MHAKQGATRQTSNCTSIFDSVCDSSAREVVWGELYTHSIAWKYLNKVFANLAGYVGENLVAVIELDAKHRIGQGFSDCSLKFDDALFSHSTTSFGRLVSISGSPSVISKECSKCAEGL